MRVVLKVTSGNEHYSGGCEYALLDLTPELAGLALGRIAVLKELEKLDPHIDESRYWTHFVVRYFDPWAGSEAEDHDDMSSALGDRLNELRIEENGFVCVAEDFCVAPSQCAAVECERMIARADSVAFTAIPRHCGFRVETREVPLATIESAAAAAR